MEDESNTGHQTNKQPVKSQIPFGDAFSQVIENLKNQPLLLFVLGAAILVLGIATMKLEKMRILILPLFVLFVLGIAAWVFLETLRMTRKGKSVVGTAKAGKVAIGKNSKIVAGSTIKAGDANSADEASYTEAGGITIEEGVHIDGSTVIGGDAKTGEKKD